MGQNDAPVSTGRTVKLAARPDALLRIEADTLLAYALDVDEPDGDTLRLKQVVSVSAGNAWQQKDGSVLFKAGGPGDVVLTLEIADGQGATVQVPITVNVSATNSAAVPVLPSADQATEDTAERQYSGAASFNYRVRDEAGGWADGNVALNVTAQNDAPWIAGGLTWNTVQPTYQIHRDGAVMPSGPAYELAKVFLADVDTPTGQLALSPGATPIHGQPLEATQGVPWKYWGDLPRDKQVDLATTAGPFWTVVYRSTYGDPYSGSVAVQLNVIDQQGGVAEKADQQALIALALENRQEMVHAPVPVSMARVEQTFSGLFEHNPGSHVVLLVHTDAGELVGLLIGCVERYFYSDALQAQLIQWYVKKAFRGTSAALVSLPLFFGVSLVLLPLLSRCVEDRFAKAAENQAFLVESMAGIETIKSMAAETRFIRQWEERLADYVKTNFHTGHLANLTQQGVQLVNKVLGLVLLWLVLLWLGARLVLGGELSVGQLIAFNMLSARVSAPILRLSTLWQEFQQMRVSLHRLGDILDTPAEAPARAAPSAGQVQGRIEFQSLGFRYRPDGRDILRDVSLSVQPGELVAVVGSSGSGKSTLARLLLRLYLPSRGRVMLDGADLQGLDPAQIRRQVAVVTQDVTLFSRSVRDNIALGLDMRERLLKEGFMAELSVIETRLEVGNATSELAVLKERQKEADSALKAAGFARAQAQAEQASGVAAELAEARRRWQAGQQDAIKAAYREDHQVLTAPLAGTVQQLAVHTVGGVVNPAQGLLVVVPQDGGIEVEAQVLNKDVGFLRVGMPATVKLDAFEFTKFGALEGVVQWIGADAVKDERLGSYYPVRIALTDTRLPVAVGGHHPVARIGMAVTADVLIGHRKAYEFFLGPLLKYQKESLRER